MRIASISLVPSSLLSSRYRPHECVRTSTLLAKHTLVGLSRVAVGLLVVLLLQQGSLLPPVGTFHIPAEARHYRVSFAGRGRALPDPEPKRRVPLTVSWRLVGNGGVAMSGASMLEPGDVDVPVAFPEGLRRIVEQNLVDLTPWHVMPRELAVARLRGLRQRYSRRYVPFARRQDNDDLACIDPERPGEVVIVHDFAAEGSELRERFDSFWAWFRSAIEEMIAFE